MEKYLNFEDNLFFVNRSIRLLSDSLSLELDGDIFHDHLWDSLNSVDLWLNHLQAYLLRNAHSLQMREFQHQMLRTRTLFQSTLAEILSRTESYLSGTLQSKNSLLKALKEQQNQEIKTLGALLDESLNEEDNPLITNKELEYLFQHEDNSES